MSAAESSGQAWQSFLQQPGCHASIRPLSGRHRRWGCGTGPDNRHA